MVGLALVTLPALFKKLVRAQKIRIIALLMAYVLTINAPLILKMRDINFFLWANYIMGHFKRYFEGVKSKVGVITTVCAKIFIRIFSFLLMLVSRLL
jgi:hypothetical protein